LILNEQEIIALKKINKTVQDKYKDLQAQMKVYLFVYRTIINRASKEVDFRKNKVVETLKLMDTLVVEMKELKQNLKECEQELVRLVPLKQEVEQLKKLNSELLQFKRM